MPPQFVGQQLVYGWTARLLNLRRPSRIRWWERTPVDNAGRISRTFDFDRDQHRKRKSAGEESVSSPTDFFSSNSM